jgi:hypothetical protein
MRKKRNETHDERASGPLRHWAGGGVHTMVRSGKSIVIFSDGTVKTLQLVFTLTSTGQRFSW